MPTQQSSAERKVRNPLTNKMIKLGGPVASRLLKQYKNKEIQLSPTFVQVLQGEKVKPLNALFQQLPRDLQACIKQRTFEFEEDVAVNIAFVKKLKKCMPKEQFRAKFGKISLCDIYLQTIEKIVGGFQTIKVGPKDSFSTMTRRFPKAVSGKIQRLADDLDTSAFDAYVDAGYDKSKKSIFPINHHAFSKLFFILNVFNFDDKITLDYNLYKMIFDALIKAMVDNKATFAAVHKTVKFEATPTSVMAERGIAVSKHLMNTKARTFVDLQKPENTAKVGEFLVSRIGVPTDLKMVLRFVDEFKLFLM